MKIKSKALEVNIADYTVEVSVDPKYAVLQEVMSRYYGLREGLNTFLKELSHPYKNWQFIVKEARGYSLDHFHLLKKHENGPAAAALYIDIFMTAIDQTLDEMVRADAVDDLMLYFIKIINDSKEAIERFIPVLNNAFEDIMRLADDRFFLFVKSYYQFKKIAESLLNNDIAHSRDFSTVNTLLVKYFKTGFGYWLSEKDPWQWFVNEIPDVGTKKGIETYFTDISHDKINELNRQLLLIETNIEFGSVVTLQRLLTLPGYNQFINTYRDIPQKLSQATDQEATAHYWKLIFLFYMMNLSGLSIIHEEILRDINRSLSWLIGHLDYEYAQYCIQKTFSVLKEQTEKFPITALNSVLTMGRGVYETDEIDLVNYYIDLVVELGFQAPMIKGVSDDWQVKVNHAHIQNIRTWLKIIEINPKWSTRLLSALIIHLCMTGVYIKDTDLFPRDITRLLNSNIEPVYYLIKQLTRLFPAYFNDIGAEGQLRDISTELDETTRRKDILIHFLRKQSHVESSNRIIGFMQAVLYFWQTGDKKQIESYVPPNIYNQIESSGMFIDGVKTVIERLKSKEFSFCDECLLGLKDANLDELFAGMEDANAQDVRRVKLIIRLYKLINQKYNLDYFELEGYLDQIHTESFPDINRLKKALSEHKLKKRLSGLLEYLEELKKIILSPKKYEIREDIYKKRHFTVDIPSMYGSYHEMKFDALGLTFRLESLVNVLFENLVDNIDLGLITKGTFFKIYDRLRLFERALKLDGIYSVEIEHQFELFAHSLKVREFSFTQYLDIFKGFAKAVKNIINDHIINIHEQNMTRILSQIRLSCFLNKFCSKDALLDTENERHRIWEIFSRDIIATSLGLQQLDVFLTKILNTLFYQSDRLNRENLHLLLNYDPQRAMVTLHRAKRRDTGIIYLGNKGFNMLRLIQNNLPVPPGFIITTEVFRCREIIDGYHPAAENFKELLARELTDLEKTTGKKFGDPKNALLLSVRSGSSISQPGMMDTYLNVGINEEIAQGIAEKTGNTWFAWDNYRRFLQCYGMSYGLKRDDFDAIMVEHKQRVGITYKRQFKGEQMRDLAKAYKSMIQGALIEIEEEPFAQLIGTIKRVLSSWESHKAKVYRKIMGISDDWGTAVTVQAMAFGNKGPQSGSGVIFTHNPRWSEDVLRLWGDFTVQGQGEDVVSGLVQTLPISKIQKNTEQRKTEMTLEADFPEIYRTLKEWAIILTEREGWGPQEIEFTFEGSNKKDLFLLQARDMAIRERKKVYMFDLSDMNEHEQTKIQFERFIGHGIGVSGGALSGRLVFSLSEIDYWRDREPNTHLILVRADTVPDDIQELNAADGILTGRGGVTSHASVVAHRLGKTCVVGCKNLVCNERDKTAQFDQIVLKSGEYISIDGLSGSIYKGLLKVKET